MVGGGGRGGKMNWVALGYTHYHVYNRQPQGSCCIVQGDQLSDNLEGRDGREAMYVYMYLTHSVVQQKLTKQLYPNFFKKCMYRQKISVKSSSDHNYFPRHQDQRGQPVHPFSCWAEQAGPGDHKRSGKGYRHPQPPPWFLSPWVAPAAPLCSAKQLQNQTQPILKQPAEWQDEKYCHKITGLRLDRGGQGHTGVLWGHILLSNHLLNITEMQSSNRIPAPPAKNVHKYLLLQLLNVC